MFAIGNYCGQLNAGNGETQVIDTAAATFSAGCATATGSRIPPRDGAGRLYFARVEVSPDGTKLAVLQQYQGSRTEMFVIERADGRVLAKFDVLGGTKWVAGRITVPASSPSGGCSAEQIFPSLACSSCHLERRVS